MNSSYNKIRSSNGAMTLVEVLISMTLGVVVIGAATWFIFEGMKASYQSMAKIENSIQQWSLSTKLQIDGKIANGIKVFNSADQVDWDDAGLPIVVGVDDGNSTNGLERGKLLVLTKTKLIEGVDSGIVTDMIFYLFTGSNSVATGTLKRFPPAGSDTFKISNATAVDASNKPKSVAQLVSENYVEVFSKAAVVQEHLRSISPNGPFAQLGSSVNASIALLREETEGGKSVKSSNLSEISINLR